MRAIKQPGLFLLFEGLPPTVIESQVLSHVRAMMELGIAWEIWAFAVTGTAVRRARVTQPQLQSEYGVVIRVFRGVRPALPFSDFANALVLAWHLLRLQRSPPFIHCRTEYATSVAIFLKPLWRFRLIWDARGDTLNEFRLTCAGWRGLTRWLAPLKIRAISARLKRAAKHADRALFVSEALSRTQGSRVPAERVKIVPCLADDRLFFYSPTLRDQARRQLGYGDRDALLIYVGSAAPWQCIPETIALIVRTLRAASHAHALIITPDALAFAALKEADICTRVTITAAALKDVNRYLNAADYGILLRALSPINRVASPVKFAEYSLAGLRVVTTNAVDQVVSFGGRIGNLVGTEEVLTGSMTLRPSAVGRGAISERAAALFARSLRKNEIATIYTGPI